MDFAANLELLTTGPLSVRTLLAVFTSSLCQGRYRKDHATQEREQANLAQQGESLQQQLGTNKDRLEQFRPVMNWNEEELQRWANAAVEKEEDRLALAQYQRQDEARVKELNARLDK